MKAWFTKNLLWKLTALLLTLVLYLFVRGDREDVRAVFVPVSVQVPTNQVLLSAPVRELKFTVRGKHSSLDRLERIGVESLVIDSTKAKNGVVEFGRESVDFPSGISVVSVKPPTMKIELEQRGRQSVLVFARVQGNVPDGYRVRSQRTIPTHVEALGPSSRLNGVAAMTEFVDISGQSQTLTTMIALRAPADPGVTLDPSSVQLIVEIEPIQTQGSFDNVKVEVHNTRYSTVTDPVSVQVTLQGPKEAIEQLSPDSIACVVDARSEDSKAPGTYKKRLEVTNLPPDVRVVGVQPSFVNLTTKEKFKPESPSAPIE